MAPARSPRSYESVVANLPKPKISPEEQFLELLAEKGVGAIQEGIAASHPGLMQPDKDGNLQIALSMSMFLTAAMNDHVNVMEIIEIAGDIEDQLDSAIAYAAASGCRASTTWLLTRGADTRVGLKEAAAKGHRLMVDDILDHIEDVGGKGAQAAKDNALLTAIEYKHLDVVKTLHRRGADIRAMQEEPLSIATLYPDYDTRQDAPLALAIRYAECDIAEYILQQLEGPGDEINALKQRMITFAIACDRPDMIDLLRRHGADIKTHNNFALNLAAATKRFRAYDYLIAQGVSSEILTPAAGKGMERRNEWIKRHGRSPAEILWLSPFLFKSRAFDDVCGMLEIEDYQGKGLHYYAYQASGLFGTTARVLTYLEKWGQAEKQPLLNIIQKISLPQMGRFNMAAWGDAVLRHGPKMAQLVKFAGFLPEPMKDERGQWSYLRTRDAVVPNAYKNAAENPALANLCFSHDWDEEDFDDALNTIREYQTIYAASNHKKPGGRIPDIAIDGKVFGKPGHRLYKLPDGDPRGLLLGEFTNCCQHLGHEAGADCAAHGFLSEESGFYVVADKEKDEIVAQSWAWRGKKGELVLDSLENLPGHMKPAQWKSLCDEFARQASGDKQAGITAIHIGKGGETPDSLRYPDAVKRAKPVGYKKDRHRDSEEQYRIWP
jgi:ankyrin repeat protein